MASFKINLLTQKHLKRLVYVESWPLYFSEEELMTAEKGQPLKTMSLSKLHLPQSLHLSLSSLLALTKQWRAVHKNHREGALLSHQNCTLA